jgi:4-amino-4-deoxy-L-arabinose transferase-like glycosyltransferase
MQGATLAPTDRAVSDTPKTFAPDGWLSAAAVGLLMLVAGYLIVPGARSLAVYGDEVRTWRDSVKESYGTILTWRHNRDHAPLSYLLVKITSDIVGKERGQWMRIPSVISGLLCIPAAFWLGRAVWSNGLGIISAALATVDVSLIWQSQQARMYPLLLLVILLGMVQVVKLANTGGKPRWRWVLLGVILGVGMWTHAQSSALLVAIVVLGITLMVQRQPDGETPKRVLQGALISLSIGLLMSSPALYRLFNIVEREEIDSPNVESIRGQFKVLGRELTGGMDLSSLLGVLMVGGLVLLAVQQKDRRSAAIALLAVGVFSVGVLLIVARFRPVHGARYVTSADPALWIGVGWVVLWALRSPYVIVRAAMGLLLAAHLGWQGLRCTQAAMIAGTHQYANEFALAVQWLRSTKVAPGDQVMCVPQIPGIYRSYYGLNTTPDMDADLRKLLTASSAGRISVWAGRQQKWTRRVTYVLAISPPEAGQRAGGNDPRRIVPLLARLYEVSVKTKGILPDKKPMRVFIFKISKKGSWVYDAKGKMLASGKPTTKPATKPSSRPVTRPATRSSS